MYESRGMQGPGEAGNSDSGGGALLPPVAAAAEAAEENEGRDAGGESEVPSDAAFAVSAEVGNGLGLSGAEEGEEPQGPAAGGPPESGEERPSGEPERTERKELSDPGEENRRLRMLRLGFTAVCAVCAVLILGLCLSFLGWRRLNRQMSAWEESSAPSGVSSGETSEESSVVPPPSVSGQSGEWEQKIDELESRAEAAERENADLRRQLEDARAELKQLNALKAAQDPEASSVPAASGNNKLVALTFDDGPGKETARLLDELKAHGMKATFFVVGERAAAYPDLLRRMADEGHEIGNHTYAHSNLTSLDAYGIWDSLTKTDDAVQAACGRVPTLMRPPGGNYNDTVKALTSDLGQRIIYWTVDTRDWQSRNVSAILKTAFQSGRYGIHDGAIVLMHDIYATSVDAAAKIMDELQKQGYRTVTVSELLARREDGGCAGEVYSFAGK